MLACFRSFKLNASRIWKSSDLGLLQGRWTQHLNFPCLTKPIGTKLWKWGSPGRKIEKIPFISSIKLFRIYSPTLPFCKAHISSKDQIHNLWHCLIYFTKELKPWTKACCLTLSVLTFPMSRRGNGDSEIQRGEDRHTGYTCEMQE